MAAVVVVLTGCVKSQEAYEAIDWKILFMIFGMIGIDLSVERTGAAEMFVSRSMGLISELNPFIIVLLVYRITVLITVRWLFCKGYWLGLV